MESQKRGLKFTPPKIIIGLWKGDSSEQNHFQTYWKERSKSDNQIYNPNQIQVINDIINLLDNSSHQETRETFNKNYHMEEKNLAEMFIRLNEEDNGERLKYWKEKILSNLTSPLIKVD